MGGRTVYEGREEGRHRKAEKKRLKEIWKQTGRVALMRIYIYRERQRDGDRQRQTGTDRQREKQREYRLEL